MQKEFEPQRTPGAAHRMPQNEIKEKKLTKRELLLGSGVRTDCL